MTVAVVAALAFCVAGCWAPQSSSKAGGPAPARVLVLANNDDHALAGAPAVDRFVDQVAELSGGRLQISVQSLWEGGNDEANVVRDVASGKADLGWAGSRVFGDLGVDSLRALSAPFLVDSYRLQAAVLRGGQARLLADVPSSSGVAPLAVLADALRYPVARRDPVLGLSDWAKLAMRTAPSADQATAFSDLGAQPVLGGGFSDGLDDGSIDGGEMGWEGFVALHIVDRAPFITANAALWPRADVVFADPDLLANLRGDERKWLSLAAADALDWSLVHAGDRDATYQAEACERGAQVAFAKRAQLVTLQSAAAKTIARLRAKPKVAELIGWIESVKAAVPPPEAPDLPTSCTYAPERDWPLTDIQPLTGPGPTGSLPDGTYRYRLTSELLHSRGVPDAARYAGLQTWTLRDGHWKLTSTSDEEPSLIFECSGYYAVRGVTVQFTRIQDQAYGDCAPPDWTARWSNDDDGITWANLVSYPASFEDFAPWFVDLHWTHIG